MKPMIVECPNCKKQKRTYNANFLCCGMKFPSAQNNAYKPSEPSQSLQNQSQKETVEKDKVKSDAQPPAHAPSSDVQSSSSEAEATPKEESGEGVNAGIPESPPVNAPHKPQEAPESPKEKDPSELFAEPEKEVTKADYDALPHECPACQTRFDELDNGRCPNPNCAEELEDV